MHRTTLAGSKRTITDTIADQLLTADATVLMSTMKVTRAGKDGGVAQ
jgi:hypothetical protein